METKTKEDKKAGWCELIAATIVFFLLGFFIGYDAFAPNPVPAPPPLPSFFKGQVLWNGTFTIVLPGGSIASQVERERMLWGMLDHYDAIDEKLIYRSSKNYRCGGIDKPVEVHVALRCGPKLAIVQVDQPLVCAILATVEIPELCPPHRDEGCDAILNGLMGKTLLSEHHGARWKTVHDDLKNFQGCRKMGAAFHFNYTYNTACGRVDGTMVAKCGREHRVVDIRLPCGCPTCHYEVETPDACPPPRVFTDPVCEAIVRGWHGKVLWMVKDGQKMGAQFSIANYQSCHKTAVGYEVRAKSSQPCGTQHTTTTVKCGPVHKLVDADLSCGCPSCALVVESPDACVLTELPAGQIRHAGSCPYTHPYIVGFYGGDVYLCSQ